MEKKKYLHKIAINFLDKDFCEYKYQFGNTKNIVIQIGKSGISIVVRLTKKTDKSEIFKDKTYLFSDAIKKAVLLYLISNNRPLVVNKVTIQIDDEIELRNIEGNDCPLIYSLILQPLNRVVNKDFLKEACVDEILSQTKSSYDSRIASLFALLCAKSKLNETERFMYLWMSFNGLYGYYAYLVGQEQGKTISREYKQIKFFQELYSFGSETIADDKDKKEIANEVMSILKHAHKNITKSLLESSEGKEVSDSIEKALKKKDGVVYNITPYGYLLTQLTYYLRCNLFHGNKPVKLLCFGDDSELVCLRVVNKLLEEFLDCNLYKWFDGNYIKNIIVPEARKVKI